MFYKSNCLQILLLQLAVTAILQTLYSCLSTEIGNKLKCYEYCGFNTCQGGKRKEKCTLLGQENTFHHRKILHENISVRF